MMGVFVPANAVYHPYIPERIARLFQSNTNGLASGNILEEAIFHGIMEVVERDAWSIFESKRRSKPEINCENIRKYNLIYWLPYLNRQALM